MLSVRDFWRRHRRKIFLSAGVLGGGYCLYKLYGAHRQRLHSLERELQLQRETEDLLKSQMQAHFENIQRISDTTTLPHSMHNLSCRIAEDLDLSHLLERLIQGKGQPNTLTQSEKLELWGRLKILSFTRMTLSVWATVMLSLYTKVQVNILGRHLYIDTARRFESSNLLTESGDVVDGEDQQKFLGSVDFLSQHGMPALISDMEVATKEVLKGAEFGSVVEICLKAVVDTLAELMGTTSVPLARALPQVAQMCPLLLEEPSKNQFIQIIKNIPDVELFLTFLYANMPSA